MTNRITALFDTLAAAERAAYELATKVSGVRGEIYDQTSVQDFHRLALPAEDLETYGEGVRRGGAVVTAEVPDDRFDAAADVLEAAGAVELDAREAEWRKSGWAGTAAASTATTSSTLPGAMTAGGTATAPSSGTAASARPATQAAMSATTGATRGEDEQVIPVVEEKLRVGKRAVEHGRVRIRAYVVDTPVSETVTLRDEHVDVQRRPVDRPVTEGDRLFEERSIEAVEHGEEAVVSKEARVKEEVVLRKTAEEHQKTVQDKVRHTEVKVEDERDAAARAAMPRNPA